VTTAIDMAAAVEDGTRSWAELLAMASELAGPARPCSLCERGLHFGKVTCHDCEAILLLASSAAREAAAGSLLRFLVFHPDGTTIALPQRVTSMADSVCVDLRAPLVLQLKSAARLRRPEVLARARAERAGN
jgi:hypothetical protein